MAIWIGAIGGIHPFGEIEADEAKNSTQECCKIAVRDLGARRHRIVANYKDRRLRRRIEEQITYDDDTVG